MAEADVPKMTNGEVKLNGDHSQARAKHMASSSAAGPESTHCRVCSKRVYEMEKLVADNMVYHKTCFKCCKCTRTLRVGNYASMDAQIFCKPHFIECFKQKGNYEEGFGKERHKNKWIKSENGSENEAEEDQPAASAHSSERNRIAGEKEVGETVSAACVAQPSHSAPPPAVASASACADVVDGEEARSAAGGDGETTAHSATDDASGRSKTEPVVVSVSEKKSKFFQAIAESAKPKEHKPEPGKLKVNAWTGRSDAQHSSGSSTQPRRVLEGLGSGKSAAGISDKKSLFESATSTGPVAATGTAAPAPAPTAAPAPAAPSADQPPTVALRPRRISPVRSSESWRRSASVDDYDGRWSHSAHATKAQEAADSSAESNAPGERQSRSTTRAPSGSRGSAAAAVGGSGSSGELSIVEQKRRAFQQRQNTEPAASTEKRSVSAAATGPLSPGATGSLKRKMEEFERKSAEQAEAARREARPKSETESEAKQEPRTQQSLPPPEAAAAAHPPSPKHRLPQMSDEAISPVAEAVVLPSTALHVQLECSPPPVTDDTAQHVHAPHLAAVPEAVDEDPVAAAAAAAGTEAAAVIEANDARRRKLSDEAVGDDDCFEKPQDATSPVKEISSIRSRFEAGGAADGKSDAAGGYRSAAREEIDAIRGSSPAGGAGGARSRYERALEETSRKLPPKQQALSSSASAADQTDSTTAGTVAGEQISAEVASLKSRFESGVVPRDDTTAGGEEAAAASRPAPSSGTARLRYQKALEDSSTRPVPKSSSPTDILPRAAAGAEDSSGTATAAGVAAASEHGQATPDGDAKCSAGADNSKRKDIEFQPVAISSLKSRFEGGADAANESTHQRSIDADVVATLHGAGVLARYKKALEETTSKPIAKTEAVPTLTSKAVSLRVRGASSTDAIADPGKAPEAAAVVAPPPAAAAPSPAANASATVAISPPAATSPVANASAIVDVELAASSRSRQSAAADVADSSSHALPDSVPEQTVAAVGASAAAAVQQPIAVAECTEEKIAVVACQPAAPVPKDGTGDSIGSDSTDACKGISTPETDVAAGEPATAAAVPIGSSSSGQRERKRPADIQLGVKDTSIAASTVPAKSPSARSPCAVPPQSSPAAGSSSQIHRLMNKFQPHVDAQPPPAPGGRAEPKPLKIPGTFEGSRASTDGGDTKATAAVSLSVTTKSTKSLKERFEGNQGRDHGPTSSSSSRTAAEAKRSNDDAASSSTAAGGPEDAGSLE